jgi:uncharacterized membrane protein YfhO
MNNTPISKTKTSSPPSFFFLAHLSLYARQLIDFFNQIFLCRLHLLARLLEFLLLSIHILLKLDYFVVIQILSIPHFLHVLQIAFQGVHLRIPLSQT